MLLNQMIRSASAVAFFAALPPSSYPLTSRSGSISLSLCKDTKYKACTPITAAPDACVQVPKPLKGKISSVQMPDWVGCDFYSDAKCQKHMRSKTTTLKGGFGGIEDVGKGDNDKYSSLRCAQLATSKPNDPPACWPNCPPMLNCWSDATNKVDAGCEAENEKNGW